MSEGCRETNGKVYLRHGWTDIITERFHQIDGFHCCLKMKTHYVYKGRSQSRLFSCPFSCTIGNCPVKGTAEITMDGKLNINFSERNANHVKDGVTQFKARHIRQAKRDQIGKQLQAEGKNSPNKLWHKKLANLDVDDFASGYLKDMPNTKDVYKTIKSEAAKSMLVDDELIKSIIKLKKHFEFVSKESVIKGFIQFVDLDPFALGLWTQSDVEIFHDRSKTQPIIIDATCGIVAPINDKRVFHMTLITGNGEVKTEPIPVFQLLTDRPDEQTLRSGLDRFLVDERRRYGPLANVTPLIGICDISWPIIKALLRSFNNMDLNQYIECCYRILTGQASENELPSSIGRILVIILCLSHIMKAFTFNIKKCLPKDSNKTLIGYACSVMLHSTNIGELKESILHIFTILLSPTKNAYYSTSKDWLDNKILELDDDTELINLSVESKETKMATAETIKHDPFLEDPRDEEKQLQQSKRSKFYGIGQAIFKEVERKLKALNKSNKKNRKFLYKDTFGFSIRQCFVCSDIFVNAL